MARRNKNHRHNLHPCKGDEKYGKFGRHLNFLLLDATRITDTTSILAKVMKNMANLVGTLICYCMLRKHDLDNTGGLEMYPWPQDLESVSFENVSSNFAA